MVSSQILYVKTADAVFCGRRGGAARFPLRLRHNLYHGVAQHNVAQLIALLQHQTHGARLALAGVRLHDGVLQARVKLFARAVDHRYATLFQRFAQLAMHHAYALVQGGVGAFGRQRALQIVHHGQDRFDEGARAVLIGVGPNGVIAAAEVFKIRLDVYKRQVITLAAALQSLPGAAESSYTCTGGVSFGEHQRVVTDYGAAAHGTLTLKDAFMKSCNSTFAMLACQMGDKALRKTAQSFGLDDAFTFRDLVVENSAYASSSAALLGTDLAWTGAGQNQLAVTPLHMCMVAAAVANDGVMMEPRLLLRAVGAEGAERQTFEPAVYRTAMDAQTAATVREYMRAVVTGGTGRSAAVRGLTVCAKTGTAEIDTQEKDNAWFIGFIDDDAYPFAVCVAVENAGTGGAVAAPIAQKIFARLAGK